MSIQPLSSAIRRPLHALALTLGVTLSMLAPLALAQSDYQPQSNNDTLQSRQQPAQPSGPIRLEDEPGAVRPDGTQGAQGTQAQDPARRDKTGQPRSRNEVLEFPMRSAAPGEFELYVRKLAAPNRITRFGTSLLSTLGRDDAPDYSPLVPADYVVQVGDELNVSIWGSVDADLRRIVDRSGRISIPRVGTLLVAGVRYAELPDLLTRRTAQVFKNFQLSVSLGQLRGVRVYVTGFVEKPGAVTVSGLSTVSGALLKAGGPSAAGSLRQIELKRAQGTVAQIDLYKLLLDGDRTGDLILQPGDVIHVGPVGPQIALLGSVNQPAIFELKPGETVTDALRMAGGFSAVADTSRLTIERLDKRSSVRINELTLPASANLALNNGDVVRAYSAISASLPVQRQNKRVRVEGEVARPGDYLLPPDSSLVDALKAAGGLTTAAFVYGSEFSRESVRLTQQENYDRALRDMQTEFARNQASTRVLSSDDAAAVTSRDSSTQRLLERLRAIKPTGRVVLQVPRDSQTLPEIALEDGDRLYVPPRPTTVGVFGSVFNSGNYLYSGQRRLDEYLRLAGGPTRGADDRSIFVIRANGSVVSALQDSGWLGSSEKLTSLEAEAGDTIFVPEEMNKTTWVQNAKDWTQILYQFGIGLAGMKSATR